MNVILHKNIFIFLNIYCYLNNRLFSNNQNTNGAIILWMVGKFEIKIKTSGIVLE